MRNIQVRVPDDLHMKAKMRMIAEWGDDNFQRLLLEFVEYFAAGNPSKVPVRSGGAVLSNTVRISPAADMLPEDKRFLDALVLGMQSGDPTIKILCLGVQHVLKDKGYASKADKPNKHQRSKAG